MRRDAVNPILPLSTHIPDGEPCISHAGDERFIAGMASGTQAVYKYFELEGDVELSITARGAAGVIDANLGVRIPVSPSTAWRTYTARANVAHGIYPLALTYRGGGEVDLLEFGIRRI